MSMFRFGMSVIDNYQGTKTTAVVSSYNKKHVTRFMSDVFFV